MTLYSNAPPRNIHNAEPFERSSVEFAPSISLLGLKEHYHLFNKAVQRCISVAEVIANKKYGPGEEASSGLDQVAVRGEMRGSISLLQV